MNKSGPIIVIEDDSDDRAIFSSILHEMKLENKIIFFEDGSMALDYLQITVDKPFLILSDINLPKLSGIELKDKIYNNEQLRLRCIPYIFFTTSANHRDVIDAYSKSVQGFFVKPANYADLKKIIHNIINYWKDCMAPNYTR